ncbi:MAG: hypothetical protein HWN68_11300 [Desulfobacterales bacterium]|nr:hypothetical protein [Desulfobacterales bacterium]
MSDIFEKKGRKASPTPQELEFLFSLMEKGYEPREIAFEYQDTDFLPRDQRFIRSQRRYFDAARKVLGESIKAQQDPVVVEARKKHTEDLCGFIDELIEELYRIEEFTLLSDSCYYFCHPNRPGVDSITPIIEVQGGPLFGALHSHLKNERVWELYEKWKESMRQAIKQEFAEEIQLPNGGVRAPSLEELSLKYGGLKRQQDIDRFELIDALVATKYRRALPGACELCP